MQNTGALQGIKVLDLSRILAGPWASQLLADMGAQVIKVEQPKKGDDTRYWGPPFIENSQPEQPDYAAYFHCANRNKQSIAVDIKTSQGQAIIHALARKADVIIENFKVGGLKQYQLDYDYIKTINPRLVYCSITGFGQTGPWAHKAGYDAMIQAEGGLMSLTGEPNGSPIKVGVAVVDVMTGLYASNAILAALFARQQRQLGQYIDIALLDVQLATLANQSMNYLASGKNPQRCGNAHPNIVPYQSFATQDGSILLAIGNDTQFEKFCQRAQCAELAQNPNFQTNSARVKHRKALVPLLASIIAKQTSQWWLNALEQISVPVGAINSVEQVFAHEQIKHRKMLKHVNDQTGKTVATVACPINMSATPLSYQSAAPNLGQHSQALLKQELALDDDAIEQLFKQGIIG
ncbi:CaiB/BaiF CoA transferase family protein [Thalassotalea sp. PLHSN55]|uniref:CaiB/BaiF CoA transferase family protein n=1 Tax=Thalassotalea sp. PLHSN55 TaxID=3435888 RepID=UPI003F84C3F3